MGYEKTSGGVFMPVEKIAFSGHYYAKHLRGGKVIDEFDTHNLVTYQGLDSLLGVMFTNASQITSWFIGIFSGNYTPVATDTAATFPASATEITAYSGSTRPAFLGTEATQNVTNTTSVAAYTFSAPVSVWGGFLSSSAVKSGVAGILFSAAKFTAAKSMDTGDQLLVTYSFTGSSVV